MNRKQYRKGGTRPGELPEKEYWKRVEKAFSPYWGAYPDLGRLEYETCKENFIKMRNVEGFPPPEIFYGIVSYLQKNIWPYIVPSNPHYVPRLSKFIDESEWKNVGRKKLAEIERDREFYKKELERRLKEFDGEPDMPPPQQSKNEEKPQQERLPISDEIPSVKEIRSMPLKEQTALSEKYGYGFPIGDFIDAVEQRDQLRNQTRRNV